MKVTKKYDLESGTNLNSYFLERFCKYIDIIRWKGGGFNSPMWGQRRNKDQKKNFKKEYFRKQSECKKF